MIQPSHSARRCPSLPWSGRKQSGRSEHTPDLWYERQRVRLRLDRDRHVPVRHPVHELEEPPITNEHELESSAVDVASLLGEREHGRIHEQLFVAIRLAW